LPLEGRPIPEAMKTTLLKFLVLTRPLLTSKVFLSVCISFLLAFVAVNTDLYRVEAFFYDLRMRLKGSEPVHPDVQLLIIGPQPGAESTETEESLEDHVAVLEQILKHKPKAVVYLNKFDPVEVDTKTAATKRFLDLAQQADAQGSKVIFGTDLDLSGEVLPPYPLSLLSHFPAVLHKDGTVFAEDKVMRRALLTAFDTPSVHMRVAFPALSKEQLLEKVKSVRGAYFFDIAAAWHMMIRYPEDTTVQNSHFPKVYFSEALAGRGLDSIEGKIVLVDAVRKDAMNDYAFTPYSRQIYTNPRILVHAAILDTLLKNRGLVVIKPAIDIALTFLLALALAFVAISMSPSRGVAALFLLSGLLFGSSLILFKVGFWLPLVHPLLAMFFTYYLIVPYRAILEYKKRWEVQEKHDLLVQVEEMKGNFLSLMSHDLKTPVARIQGLAEMVIRQGNLTSSQNEELRQIISSTESLDKFISKILNLTKVESNEIKISKRSKDINKILEQCVDKLDFQARAKQVRVEKYLEPLFPIQVDAALLMQVFTNIIDNAIKYSPSGSTVKVTSREVGDFVEVTVEDNGPGMDEGEQEQLFTKFFRGNAIPGDPIKGSGLGLYLSRYFIEMHQGTIIASSQKGLGTKFTIQLPIEGDAV
jgi:signal transduction histidine kinase